MTDQLELPESVIMTGYMLEKAERKYIEYLWEAVKCGEQAVKDLKAMGLDIELLDFHSERKDIFQAMSDAQIVKKVHKRSSRKLVKKFGLPKPTQEQFDALGAGGNR